MIKSKLISFLQSRKNLLAFSAGGDSTALFFLLLEHKISFDIAIVDYGVREQSKDEVKYAQELASKYSIECYVYRSAKIEKNFEAQARSIRYSFFDTLVQEYSYDVVLSAHHLGDRFEWMLMQFCKGAGCIELSGMKEVQKREKYTLVRPLLQYEKSELLAYLKKNNIKYFEDQSNYDEKFQRNKFRHHFSEPLLKEYASGIRKSFSYLDEDKENLIQDVEVKNLNQFYYFPTSTIRSDLYHLDYSLKKLGYILKAKERKLLEIEKVLVVGRKYLVVKDRGYIFFMPYIKQKDAFSKSFKEECRNLKIEPKMRAYLNLDTEVYSFLKFFLKSF